MQNMTNCVFFPRTCLAFYLLLQMMPFILMMELDYRLGSKVHK